MEKESAVKTLSDIKNYDLIILDSMNMANRYHYALQSLKYKGKSTGMLFGVMKFILNMMKSNPRAEFIFLWEGVNSRRKLLMKSYKGNRTRKDNTFLDSLDILKEWICFLGIDSVCHSGVEADDLAGYYVENNPDKIILLVSNDEDWFQFMRQGNIFIYRKTMAESYEDIKFYLGFPPERVGIYKILTGGKSVNVEGLDRFPTEAARLICNSCKSYKDIKNFPLSRYNKNWGKYEALILNNWIDVIERNAKVLLYNNKWIHRDEICFERGWKDWETLKVQFLMKGMKSLSDMLVKLEKMV